MSFTEYLRLCLALGLAALPILAFAFGLAFLVEVSPLHDPATIAMTIAATIFVGPALACLAARIMDALAPDPHND